jgi:hypothetical protein
MKHGAWELHRLKSRGLRAHAMQDLFTTRRYIPIGHGPETYPRYGVPSMLNENLPDVCTAGRQAVATQRLDAQNETSNGLLKE